METKEIKKEVVNVTFFKVVYRNQSGNVEVLPYIDLDRRSDIWGIELYGKKICRFEDMCTTWEMAMHIAAKNGERLLTIDEFMDEHLRADANTAFDILSKNGVCSDPFNKDYWTSTPYKTVGLIYRAGNAYKPEYLGTHCYFRTVLL